MIYNSASAEPNRAESNKEQNASRVVALHTEENSATSPSKGALHPIEAKTGIGCLDAETRLAKENNVRVPASQEGSVL